MSPRRQRSTPVNLLIIGVVGVVILAGILALRARSQEPTADPSTAGSGNRAAELEALLEAPASSGALADSDPNKSHILSKTSLADAIAVARPLMTNTVGRLDVGSALLALWASKNLSWQELEALPETSPALFKKDPDAERGRRFCMSGTVLEIRAEKSLVSRLAEDKALPLIERSPPNTGASDNGFLRTDPLGTAPVAPSAAGLDPLLMQGSDFTVPNGGKVYFALIVSKSEPPAEGAKPKGPPKDSVFVEIIAVKSSGALVDGNDARVCGVLTGVTVPPAGGSTSASMDSATVHRIVGMFDLPQNRVSNGVDVTAQHG